MDSAKSNHHVVLEGWRRAEISGVTDLLVFDETEVIMETTEGMLSIRGGDLHMSSLSLEQGLVGVSGEITELIYDEIGQAGKNRPGLMGRLFHS